jgi:hypothetical protein
MMEKKKMKILLSFPFKGSQESNMMMQQIQEFSTTL